MSRLFPIAVAAVLIATAANAAEPSYGQVSRSVEVSHADLDLRTEQGARTMLRRLNAAASHACGEAPAAGIDFQQRTQAWRACRSASLAAAVSRLGSPRVREVYNEDGRQTAKLTRR